MSQPSSNFDDSVGFEEAYDPAAANPGDMEMLPAPPAYQKQGFSTYTVMLIASFVFLTAAAIILFMESNKY